jgi:manganese/zinc/iron transport system permease protein
VLGIEALRATGLVAADAAIGLVFPALFALGVLGVQRYADGLHLDLDATIYGEIAFVPFRTWILAGVEIAQGTVVAALVALADLIFVTVLWKELKATSFDPGFSRSVGIPPKWLGRGLLTMVAVTAVCAFESVGAILVVTLFIVPAAAAFLLTDRLVAMVAIAPPRPARPRRSRTRWRPGRVPSRATARRRSRSGSCGPSRGRRRRRGRWSRPPRRRRAGP